MSARATVPDKEDRMNRKVVSLTESTTLPTLALRERPAEDVTYDAAVDAAGQQAMIEAMRSRFAPEKSEADAPLDGFDLRLLGNPVVQIRMNMALSPRDVLHQLRSIRRCAEQAIAILEGPQGTSASRRILAKHAMEAARNTVRETRRAAGEENAK